MNRIITLNDLDKIEPNDDQIYWFTNEFPDGLEIQQNLIIKGHLDKFQVRDILHFFESIYDKFVRNDSCDPSSSEAFYTCKYIHPNGTWGLHHYNEAGFQLRTEKSYGYWQTHEYNEAGQVTRFEDSQGTWLTYEYNEAGQEIGTKYNNGMLFTYEYDEAGKCVRVRVEEPTGFWKIIEYDTAGYTTRIEDSTGYVK